MSYRIRILHLITRLVVGGAQENTLLTAAGLDRERFEVHLASGPTYGSEGSLEDRIPQGIAFTRFPRLRRDPAPLDDAITLAALIRFMRRGRYDIVHTHTTKAGLLGRLAAMIAGIRIIVHTPHGHAFHGYLGPKGSSALVRVERWLAARTARIICLTEAERDEHIALRIAPAEKFAVVHSGIELAEFNRANGNGSTGREVLGLPAQGPLVGCVARLVPVKGVDILLEAAPGILAQVPEASLVFVGDGPMRPQMEARAQALGLNGRVTFLGLRRDVPAILPHLSLVVLPSLNEGMGKAAVEAMAAGRAVVASRVSGLQEVVLHQRTGLLVPPSDSTALASAIARLLRDDELRESYGLEGRRRALAFSADAMVAQIASLYESILPEI